MVGFELIMDQHLHHVNMKWGADIDMRGNHVVDAALDHIVVAASTEVAPTKFGIPVRNDKKCQEQGARRFSQQSNLNDMMMMKEYPMTTEQANELDVINIRRGVSARSKPSLNDMNRSSRPKQQNQIEISILKDLQNLQSPTTIYVQEPDNTADNISNRFIVKQANSKRHLRRSSSCMFDVKENKGNIPLTESNCEIATKRGPANILIDDNKPKSWANRTPSNIVDNESRGLQRSTSLRMIPSASFSSRTSNHSNHETLTRQTSVRMMPSSSFSSRGSRQREQLPRQSSAQMVPNVSFSSRESNNRHQISSKREKLYRRSSAHFVQNVSHASRNSNSSSESFGQREKMNRRASTSSKHLSTRKLESPGTSFIDRVIETSNELHHMQKFNTSSMEHPTLHTPKEKSRSSARPRRSSMTLEMYFAVTQNEIEPQPDLKESSESGNNSQLRYDHTKIVCEARNDRIHQRRRGSTGTINM